MVPRVNAGSEPASPSPALHRNLSGFRLALQTQLDALPKSSRVVVGYGLCGNGVLGLHSGRHTLITPRVHDCIALLVVDPLVFGWGSQSEATTR
jgi:uncharacterized protein YgbK (DUF1537 family)